MSTRRWIRSGALSGLVALSLCVVFPRMLTGQGAVPIKEQADDAAAFGEFSARVQAYVTLRKMIESSLPALKPTDLPEIIAAHEQVLARRIREARPHAERGDLLTHAAREAFRRASHAAIRDLHSVSSRAYMQQDAPNPAMPLAVNGVYPDTEPITALSPELLAAFPPLPAEVAYRIVGTTLIVVDVVSRLIVDFARRILPQMVLSGSGAPEVAFPLEPNSVRLAVIGDMGTGKQPEIDVAQQMVKLRAVFPFEFVITLGDNIYTGSRPSDFEKAFALPYKPLLEAGVQFYATLGNHDMTNERFYKPFNMDGANYYTYKKGNVRFLALDTNYMDRKQIAWLETQLRDAGNGDWKICYFHHPLYSSARNHGPAIDLRKVLEPLFLKYGVDVVLAGHDHVYERAHPQQGIYYFTEGASGALRSGDLKPSTITAKGFDADRSFMLIEITGDEMYFQATSRTGVTVDSGVIHRTIRPTTR